MCHFRHTIVTKDCDGIWKNKLGSTVIDEVEKFSSYKFCKNNLGKKIENVSQCRSNQ